MSAKQGLLAQFGRFPIAWRASVWPAENCCRIDNTTVRFAGTFTRAGTRTRDLCVTGRYFDLLVSVRRVVVLENDLQCVGEDVGGGSALGQEAAKHAKWLAGERRYRTQEVAGSSPASSTSKRPAERAFFVLRRGYENVQNRGVVKFRSSSRGRGELTPGWVRSVLADKLVPAAYGGRGLGPRADRTSESSGGGIGRASNPLPQREAPPLGIAH
jgi:hypothetical protein